MKLFASVCLAVFSLAVLPLGLVAQELGSEPSTSGPVLAHEPVSVAVQGEPLTILTRVATLGSPVRSVTLHYSLSKDGSPASESMNSTGQGVYIGTIPANLFRTANSIWYYIEAVDEADEWAETSWHQVLIKRSDALEPPPFANPAGGTRPNVAVPASATAPARAPVIDNRPEKDGFATPAVVVGGAVLVGAGVIAAIASSDGGSGGGASDTPPAVETGTPPETSLDCVESDLTGAWSGSDPAPRFTLFANNSALFDFPDGETVGGSWTLGPGNCVINLMPDASLSTNNISVYQGSDTVRTEGSPFTVVIKGRTFSQAR